MLEPGALRRRAAAVDRHRDGERRGRVYPQAFRKRIDRNVIDEPRRIGGQVDDADRADAAVADAVVALVGGEGEMAVEGDLNVVGPTPDGDVFFIVAHRLPVDVEPGDLVDGVLGDERVLAVRRDGDRRDGVAEGDGLHRLHLLAVDGQHGDGVVGAVGDENETAGLVDRHAGGLLADFDGRDQRRWGRLEIDDEDLVVGDGLPAAAVVRLVVQGIGDQRQRLVRRDGEVGGRPDDGVGQRQRGDDFWLFAILDVDDYDLVLARRGESRFAGIVPVQLVVIADDQKLRLGGGGNSANEGNSCGLRGEP